MIEAIIFDLGDVFLNLNHQASVDAFKKLGLNEWNDDLKAKTISFVDVIAAIDSLYHHTPTAFKNGDVFNEANQNQGSAKVFSFAKINQLTAQDTLALFAEHYEAVLNTPEGNDHQNIRQFMQYGWDGVKFETSALSLK